MGVITKGHDPTDKSCLNPECQLICAKADKEKAHPNQRTAESLPESRLQLRDFEELAGGFWHYMTLSVRRAGLRSTRHSGRALDVLDDHHGGDDRNQNDRDSDISTDSQRRRQLSLDSGPKVPIEDIDPR